jgi:uncharacterized protein YjbJ (UPF0337 family)
MPVVAAAPPHHRGPLSVDELGRRHSGGQLSADKQIKTSRSRNRERTTMTDKHVDEAKGRLKEAAGSLTDDHDLKHKGKADQAKATFKDKVDKVVDALGAHDKEVGRT